MALKDVPEYIKEVFATYKILTDFGYKQEDLSVDFSEVNGGYFVSVVLFPDDPFSFAVVVSSLPFEQKDFYKEWPAAIDAFEAASSKGKDQQYMNSLMLNSSAYKEKVNMLLAIGNNGVPAPDAVEEYRKDPSISEKIREFVKNSKENDPEIAKMEQLAHSLHAEAMAKDLLRASMGSTAKKPHDLN